MMYNLCAIVRLCMHCLSFLSMMRCVSEHDGGQYSVQGYYKRLQGPQRAVLDQLHQHRGNVQANYSSNSVPQPMGFTKSSPLMFGDVHKSVLSCMTSPHL